MWVRILRPASQIPQRYDERRWPIEPDPGEAHSRVFARVLQRTSINLSCSLLTALRRIDGGNCQQLFFPTQAPGGSQSQVSTLSRLPILQQSMIPASADTLDGFNEAPIGLFVVFDVVGKGRGSRQQHQCLGLEHGLDLL
jgi:hypothetical protein